MTYIIDASAIVAILLGQSGAEQAVELLENGEGESKVQLLVPFTAMAELEAYMLLRLPSHIEQVMALVGSWPIQILESYPEWRHQAVRLRASLGTSWQITWVASLAMLQNAPLVFQDPVYEAIPGLRRIKIG